MAASHGIGSSFHHGLWASPHRTPPFYPDAVTLAPGVPAAEVLTRVDTTSPGCSVKDSFSDLDLSGPGFAVLMEGSWLVRQPGGPTNRAPWERVRDAAGLRAWEAAWSWGRPGDDPLFRESLLARPEVVIVTATRGPDVVAGAVVSCSGATVGLSNVFAVDGEDVAAHWSRCVAAATESFPGLPVVGWETGDHLPPALAAGFSRCGDLRVWMATSASGDPA